MVKITGKKARKVANILGLDLRRIPLKEWHYAMQIELEHGTEIMKTNVTNDDLLMTGKIALAHLLEFPDYYRRLKKMEHEGEMHWKGKKKPNILTKRGKSHNSIIKNNVEKDIQEFLKLRPNPTDKEIHEFANVMGINKHKFEEIIYAMLSKCLNALN